MLRLTAQGYLKITGNRPIPAFASQIDNTSNDPSISTGVSSGAVRCCSRLWQTRTFARRHFVVNPNNSAVDVSLIAREGNTTNQVKRVRGTAVPLRTFLTESTDPQFYLGNGNITQPSTNATPRKVKKTVAPYWSRSCGDSFEVSEKTMETQNAKIVRAVKCDSSIRLLLSADRDIESIQDDQQVEQTSHRQEGVPIFE